MHEVEQVVGDNRDDEVENRVEDEVGDEVENDVEERTIHEAAPFGQPLELSEFTRLHPVGSPSCGGDDSLASASSG